eukprot:gnl/MRDRNA2_/MRDRNA2_130518_c0_seq1.p1 gnl/MRDRNA2_/MRDRNA2_130518_c0~~gnl/MRDRNA2_/MRDRNA2_130518_c0_seq1.p1  ORF type:complete len:147 (+),score=30.86 gnl/MRDRNA2_/MRDRNA2_130518_c0_seq1:81-521(+)
MRRVSKGIVLGIVAHGNSAELAVEHAADAKDSSDDCTDLLINRAFKAWVLHRTDLEDTMCAKPETLKAPTVGSLSLGPFQMRPGAFQMQSFFHPKQPGIQDSGSRAARFTTSASEKLGEPMASIKPAGDLKVGTRTKLQDATFALG